MGLEIRDGQCVDGRAIDFSVSGDSCRILASRAGGYVQRGSRRGVGAIEAHVKFVITVDIALEIEPDHVHRFSPERGRDARGVCAAALIALQRRGLAPRERWRGAIIAIVAGTDGDSTMGTKSVEDTGRRGAATEHSSIIADGEFTGIARSRRCGQHRCIAAESRIEFVVGIDIAIGVQSKEFDWSAAQIDGFAGIVDADSSIAKFGGYAAPFQRRGSARSALVPPTQMNSAMVIERAFCQGINRRTQKRAFGADVGDEFTGRARSRADGSSTRTAARTCASTPTTCSTRATRA